MSTDEIFKHVQSVKENVAQFRKKFKAHPSAGQFSILDDAIRNLPPLVKFAVQLDYKEVKANGVRSLIRACDNLSRTALTISDEEVDDFLYLVSYLNRGADLLLEGCEDTLNGEFTE